MSIIGVLSPKSGLERLDIDAGQLEVWGDEGSVSDGCDSRLLLTVSGPQPVSDGSGLTG